MHIWFIQTYVHTYTYVTHTNIDTYIPTYLHSYIHNTYILIYIHTYIYTCTHTLYIRTYIRACIHTFIHTPFVHSVEPEVCQNDSRMLSRKYRSIKITQRIQKYYSTKCYKHFIYSIINHLYTQHIKNGKKVFLFFQKQFYGQCFTQHHHLSLSLSLHFVTSSRLSSAHSCRNRRRAWPSLAAPRNVGSTLLCSRLSVCPSWSSPLFQWLELEAAC